MSKVSLIVFTCNRPQDLERCLVSISRQTYTDFDLLVVNNGTDAETEAVLGRFSAKVIRDTTKHLAYLFNLGWKNAAHELIAYIADDAELSRTWLQEGMDTFKRHEQAAVVTGPLVSPFESTGEMHALYKKARSNVILSMFAKIYDNFILEGKTFEPGVLCESGSYTLGQGFLPNFTGDREVDLATTSAMVVKRSTIEDIGGFDENFIFNHADGDLFVRLKKKGYKIIYNPEMRAVHYVRLGPSRYPFFIGRDTAYFYLKDIRPKSLRGFIAALANIMILNLYWIYKAVKTREIKQLSGISGFIKGISDFIFKSKYDKRNI